MINKAKFYFLVFNLQKWRFLCDWFTWESWLNWLQEDLWSGFEASLAEHNILLNFLFSPRELTHMHALTPADANTPECLSDNSLFKTHYILL